MKLRWGRIIGGAFLLEFVLFLTLVPLLVTLDISVAAPLVAAGCLVFGFLVSWWILRKVQAGHVLHGTLIGVFATAIYILLVMAQPGGLASVVSMYGPFWFYTANAVRILGCAAGGFACARRS
jgi:hypothetical protein